MGCCVHDKSVLKVNTFPRRNINDVSCSHQPKVTPVSFDVMVTTTPIIQSFTPADMFPFTPCHVHTPVLFDVVMVTTTPSFSHLLTCFPSHRIKTLDITTPGFRKISVNVPLIYRVSGNLCIIVTDFSDSFAFSGNFYNLHFQPQSGNQLRHSACFDTALPHSIHPE